MAREAKNFLWVYSLTHVWVVRILAGLAIFAVLSILARLASPRIAGVIVLNIVSYLAVALIASNCVANCVRGAGLAGSVIVVVRSHTCGHGSAIR